MIRANDAALVAQAKQVLEQNRVGRFTKPAPNLYPHQWSWDSAFIAMGYVHYDQARAEEELREVETQHTSLTTERDDLTEAIKNVTTTLMVTGLLMSRAPRRSLRCAGSR